MKISCPKCKSVIPASRLNVETDMAVCDKCNEAFTISALVAGGRAASDFNVDEPPGGAWFQDTGAGWRMGATTRSALAFFLVPFMCVWSGVSLGGIYGTQIVSGQFNPVLSLFGIPFLIGTLVIGWLALMSIGGKVLVAAEDDNGFVFVGVGRHWNDQAIQLGIDFRRAGRLPQLPPFRRLGQGDSARWPESN